MTLFYYNTLLSQHIIITNINLTINLKYWNWLPEIIKQISNFKLGKYKNAPLDTLALNFSIAMLFEPNNIYENQKKNYKASPWYDECVHILKAADKETWMGSILNINILDVMEPTIHPNKWPKNATHYLSIPDVCSADIKIQTWTMTLHCWKRKKIHEVIYILHLLTDNG